MFRRLAFSIAAASSALVAVAPVAHADPVIVSWDLVGRTVSSPNPGPIPDCQLRSNVTAAARLDGDEMGAAAQFVVRKRGLFCGDGTEVEAVVGRLAVIDRSGRTIASTGRRELTDMFNGSGRQTVDSQTLAVRSDRPSNVRIEVQMWVNANSNGRTAQLVLDWTSPTL